MTLRRGVLGRQTDPVISDRKPYEPGQALQVQLDVTATGMLDGIAERFLRDSENRLLL